jgi:large subunit ribosomal protein L25
VDVSDLELDSAIHMADLDLPAGLTLMSDPQEMVAQVIYEAAPEEEEEEEELVVDVLGEVEVISESRSEEEEDGE